MKPLDLTALRKIAEAATPGNWEHRILLATKRGAVTALNDEGGLVPVVTRGIDPANSEHIAAFDPPIVIALLDRVESAELWTVAHPCQVTHEQPYDFKSCETHDRTFPLDGDCDHKGKSALHWQDDREQEQRIRAIRAEDRAEAAEAKVAAVRAELDRWDTPTLREEREHAGTHGFQRLIDSARSALGGGA